MPPKQDKTYFILRTRDGAKVNVYLSENWFIGFASALKPGEKRYDSSCSLARYVCELAEKYSREISEYEGNHGRPWNRYPRIRAVIGYLQEAGALMFDGEKIEVEDVGPPYDDAGNDDSGAFRFDDGFEIAY